jgi:histidyl-tRNA synthetase
MIQAVRGMNDLLPEAAGVFSYIETAARKVMQSYGYREIRLPIVEKTELFARSIGTETDIVEKEMYTFDDRNGESLTLRPEGTAGCVRAGIESGLLHNQVQRYWYAGPMFRHERPQKGRYRQFHQIGAEAFGLDGPELDAEQILMTARLWKLLGLQDVRLEINSLGTPEARRAYRERLVAHLKNHAAVLDDDSRRRMETNPLRVLDTKNPEMRDVVATAPVLLDHLDDPSRSHFDAVMACLDEAGIGYHVNPRLVRGLDYYTRTVFEWITTSLGAQGTVCAGGRYDGLVAQLGGKATPAAGFALGMERLAELCGARAGTTTVDAPEVFVICADAGRARGALRLAEELRSAGMRVECDAQGSLKSQMRRADRSGVRYAAILGEDEERKGEVQLKPMQDGAGARNVARSEIISTLDRLLGRAPGA